MVRLLQGKRDQNQGVKDRGPARQDARQGGRKASAGRAGRTPGGSAVILSSIRTVTVGSGIAPDLLTLAVCVP